MDLKLDKEVAFISGSTKGIGYAVARTLVQEKASVILNGRTQKSINEAIVRLKEEFPEANIIGFAADFKKATEVLLLLEQLPEVSILINNVGIYTATPFFDTPDADWYEQFDVNVMSGVRLSKHCLPNMLQKNSGRIVFVSSECASLVPLDLMAYSMTKASLMAVSRGLAQMTSGTKVTVNTVMPGSTRSEGASQFLKEAAAKKGSTTAQIEEDIFKEIRPSSLLQRFASVAEVANTIVYLASPLSSATNGAVIKIDGGSTGGIL